MSSTQLLGWSYLPFPQLLLLRQPPPGAWPPGAFICISCDHLTLPTTSRSSGMAASSSCGLLPPGVAPQPVLHIPPRVMYANHTSCPAIPPTNSLLCTPYLRDEVQRPELGTEAFCNVGPAHLFQPAFSSFSLPLILRIPHPAKHSFLAWPTPSPDSTQHHACLPAQGTYPSVLKWPLPGYPGSCLSLQPLISQHLT